MSTPIISVDALQAVITCENAVGAVRQAFIDYADGHIQQPDPMQILFKGTDGEFAGDCHVKAAQSSRQPYFVVKLAAGFYKNRFRGLEPNSGLVLVMSAETGHPVAILDDQGWLTQMRTAAAATLGVALTEIGEQHVLGLVGAGTQARLQVEMLKAMHNVHRVRVLGRNSRRVAEFCQSLRRLDIDAVAVTSAGALIEQSDVVVTTTPSTRPLIEQADWTHDVPIVALGADSPGKQELASELLGRARYVIADSPAQCAHHGEISHALASGAIDATSILAFGHLLADSALATSVGGSGRYIVDLTGLGAQDLAIASLAIRSLDLG